MDYRITSGALTAAKKLKVVSLDDVKRAERISHTKEDEFIESCIVAAFDYLHGYVGRTNGYFLLQEEIEMFVPAVENTLEIAARPIDESTITFGRRSDDASYTAIDVGDYAPFLRDGCLVLAALSTTAFPIVRGIPNPRSYRVTFKAGHESADAVPQPLKQAITLLASHWYQNREAAFPDPRTGNVSREIAFGLTSLIGRYSFSPDLS